MTKEFKKLFGTRVRHYRNLLGLSQEKLAEKIGISTHTVSYIERGKNFISMTKLSVLANALEIEPYKLFIDTNIDVDKNKIEEINRLLVTANTKQLNLIINFIINVMDIE